jgi:hypothetical protein
VAKASAAKASAAKAPAAHRAAFAARLLLGAGLATGGYLLLLALGIVEMSTVYAALG